MRVAENHPFDRLNRSLRDLLVRLRGRRVRLILDQGEEPAGTLRLGHVIVFTVCCTAGFLASTLLFWPNRLPLLLSVTEAILPRRHFQRHRHRFHDERQHGELDTLVGVFHIGLLTEGFQLGNIGFFKLGHMGNVSPGSADMLGSFAADITHRFALHFTPLAKIRHRGPPHRCGGGDAG